MEPQRNSNAVECLFTSCLLIYLLTNLHFHRKQVEASAHIQINSWHKSLLNISWCFDWKLLLCLETRKGLRATTRSSVCMCVCTCVCVYVCNVCVQLQRVWRYCPGEWAHALSLIRSLMYSISFTITQTHLSAVWGERHSTVGSDLTRHCQHD